MISTRRLAIALLLVTTFIRCSSQQKVQKEASPVLLFADDFSKRLDTSVWVAEIAPEPNSTVFTANGKLFLDTKGGVTVWLNKKLTGNVRIEFTRTVLIDAGKNDRLSDLNVFWMASDPRRSNIFTHNGVLENYDSLQCIM